ncbi:N-ATPase subunit AtpR [Tropicimonas marinistellae]|uniref:N-ATPase subunit AtpR n=1 Tax=Tropicimonas marinistellae TaxID=1739787 RepID=UPI001917F78D|nr:ATP synthase subunit I [Tropicimonas marinistellae]
MTQALVHFLLGFGLGVAAGYVHFASLKRVTRLFLVGAHLWRAVGLQLARLAALAALMVALALLGVSALLAGMIGVIVAREIVLRRVRKGP